MRTDTTRPITAALCCLVLVLCLASAKAQVRISEFMASNAGGGAGSAVLDEDGEASDWIELENLSTSPVNLLDWALTDNSGNLAKWRFPATNLPPGGFLLVFASDKDRRAAGSPLHTNFKLAAEGEYLALVNASGTVVSEFNPYPGQATDVSFGIAGTAANGVYFIQPTPGTENLGGSAMLGPGIANVRHTPEIPLAHESITVSARVFATARSVASVEMIYRWMFEPEVTIPMLDDGAHGDGIAGDGVYGALIPARPGSDGQMVRYYIRARDVNNVPSRLPVFSDPEGSAEYFGTVINPNYVTSALPVVHLFVENYTPGMGVDDPDKSGGRAAVYYDGELYDNVFMVVRGNTTRFLNKKSHRFEFNREHPFRHWGPGERLRETSFVADYVDPTYMRQGLSFWLCEEIGAPAPFYLPTRLQMNGTFYQLANHNDLHEEQLLERLGYDPRGALYNAAGTIVPSQFSTAGFDKKTRKWEDNSDYQTLANAISASLSTGRRMTNIFDMLDLPQVISYMVAARLVHENDDAWGNMSIYHDNEGDDLWRIVPFDMNLSWGAAWMDAAVFAGIQVNNDDLKSFPMYGSSHALPSAGGDNWNRLYDAIFTVPQTREMFLRRLRTVLDVYVKPPGTPWVEVPIYQKVIEWRDVIADEAARDRAEWGWPPLGGQCNFTPGINLYNGVDALLNVFLEPRRAHFYGKHNVTNVALPIGITKTSNAGIPLAQPADTVIEITGFEFNPVSGNQDEEFVRLTNPNLMAVDISGWTLSGGIEFTFAKGTVIPAGTDLYVSPNTKAFRNRSASPRGGEGRFVVGPYTGRLSARGETLLLISDTGRRVFTDGFPGNPSPAQQFLRITEIMYNPSPFPAVSPDPQQFEFIELKNISSSTALDLSGVRFTEGITFNFTGSAVTSLAPQQSVVLVRNAAAFTARFGPGPLIAGQFSGGLDGAGERLRLEDAGGEKILEFEYDDSWFPITDGLGFSLVVTDEKASWEAWGTATHWRASGQLNGSPGGSDPLPPAVGRVLINEVLSHTDPPLLDAVELFNPTDTTVDISGWFLTDDFDEPKKFRIPDGTTIAPGQYLVFDENDFASGAQPFRFSESGESAYLFAADSQSVLLGYHHGYAFGAAPNGTSFGRYTNSQGEDQFVLQSALTLGDFNAPPRIGPVVISEIMYHPEIAAATAVDPFEFIEVQNVAVTNVPLFDPSAPGNTWALRNAVDFDFPIGQWLAPGASVLVVGFDPGDAVTLDKFRTQYGISNSIAIYGPWSGRLANNGETVELKQPAPLDEDFVLPYYLIDYVACSNQAPWPAGADGIGNSLQRTSTAAFGNDPLNWFAAGATPGRANVDNIAPAIFITSPTEGATLVSDNNNIIVRIDAADPDGSVARVQLFANGIQLVDSPSFDEFVWTNAAFGTHELRARVTDDLGGVNETPPVTFRLSSVTPPTVEIIAPTNGAIVRAGRGMLLSTTTSSGGGPAYRVEYSVDGTPIGTAIYPFYLPWIAETPGDHTIAAVAFDTDGQASAPASVPVFVQAVFENPVLIPSGAEWRYLDNGNSQGTTWIAPSFDDSLWKRGNAKLGYNSGNSGLGSVLDYGPNSNNKYRTYYFRKEFVVSTLSGMTGLFLEVQRDDGVAVYLNGTPLYRNNLPAGTLSYSQLATNASDNGNTWLGAILPLTDVVIGTNVIAAEVHQSSAASTDLAFDLRLSLRGSVLGPAFTFHPQNQTREPGQDAVFQAGATGSGPFTWQWTHNGTNVPGAASDTLNLEAVSGAHAGEYRAVVANSVGVATSAVARLTVALPDSDGDGLPDAWELANGTDPAQPDASLDPDRDGHTTWQEFLAGTNPTNSASVLRLETAMVLETNVVFSFQALSNRSYSLEATHTPGGAGWENVFKVEETHVNRTFWFTNGLNPATNVFYRVVTPAPPDM